jgi:hypothetical protein
VKLKQHRKKRSKKAKAKAKEKAPKLKDKGLPPRNKYDPAIISSRLCHDGAARPRVTQKGLQRYDKQNGLPSKKPCSKVDKKSNAVEEIRLKTMTKDLGENSSINERRM